MVTYWTAEIYLKSGKTFTVKYIPGFMLAELHEKFIHNSEETFYLNQDRESSVILRISDISAIESYKTDEDNT